LGGSEKIVHQRVVRPWAWPQAAGVQGMFGHCSQAYGLIFYFIFFVWSCVEPEVGLDVAYESLPIWDVL